MSCLLHPIDGRLGYSMNSSGNYSTYAPSCTCDEADGAASAAASAALPAVSRSFTSLPMRSMGGGIGAIGAGTGAGLGLAAPSNVPSLGMTRSNGGGIQSDLYDLPLTPPYINTALGRSATNAYDYESPPPAPRHAPHLAPGFSNEAPAPARGLSNTPPRGLPLSLWASNETPPPRSRLEPPPVRRTGTEWHGVPSRPQPTEEERLTASARLNLTQLRDILQRKMDDPGTPAASHDEMAARDGIWDELSRRVHMIDELLAVLEEEV